ncbi:RHS repeat domain-containing protein [Chryseobacterium indoltheticum]|uniref:RHS repeat-associated core domain-containing protein n=1 Tax=Chryseobacterium indoltheticum TaxID=254 RepID=A0A3G6N4A1_9FLAO|nr:RHS repeat-associated core domain-containing protein [Chryseobacterium indoltheticum]AZA62810.1 RHS repeat-associated core domain-containing protein [Chryseobacterium indoltheticum]
MRLSFTREGGEAIMVEKADYYAFGLKYGGYAGDRSGANYNYEYNGKELQEETGMYDYGARFYMPDIGRWGVADPMSEATPDLSPYHYANNNPMMYNEPTGMLSQSFADNLWNSSSGTTWYNNNDGSFTNSWGDTMSNDGIGMNFNSSTGFYGGRGGGGVAGEIRLPTLYLESNNAWAAAVNIFLHHNAFMEKWNSSQAFAEKQRDWNFQMGNSSGRISMMGGAGDPFGIWEVAGMALAAKDKGNSNYILAALMITRSGNTGGLKVLNAELGAAKTSNYKSTFFNANPELKGNVVVHHAVEQQVLKRYPGVVTTSEIHSLENLRGIPKSINSGVHLSQIRKMWNRFYKQNPNPSKQQLLNQATIIDQKFGSQFLPPLK